MIAPINKILKRLFAGRRTPTSVATRQKPPVTEIQKVTLLFKDWVDYSKGQTIGTRGSEEGMIIADLESLQGARITLEKGASFAPYAITLGIYGLMFHTHFCGTLDEAVWYTKESISKIEKVFLLYETPEAEREASWSDRHEQLLADLTQ